MFRTLSHRATAFAVLVLACNFGIAGEGKSSALVQNKLVLDEKDSFSTVRHVVLRGTNQDIGRALAEIGKTQFQMKPAESSNPNITRVQRIYFERNYPILFERMKGVAESFGADVTNDKSIFSHLGYTKLRGGCSVMYIPSSKTADGKSVFSRDYDFSTAGLYGEPLKTGEKSPSGTPYVIEMHPDKGYASLSICCYDLLSGVLDGINSEGLCVALLADDQLMRTGQMEPTGDISVGLGVQQTLRMLLDTCANVEQAKEALLTHKLYYEALPCHYMVADRHGKSFVMEFSVAHNKQHFIDAQPGKLLASTNFSMHKYTKDGTPPSNDMVRRVCGRYCVLNEGIEKAKAPLTEDSIKKLHSQVDARFPSRGTVSHRTLWHALYVPESRKLSVSFYLRDEKSPNSSMFTVKRSGYLDFTLTASPGATAAK